MSQSLHFTRNSYDAVERLFRRFAGRLKPVGLFGSRFASLRDIFCSFTRAAICLLFFIAVPACGLLGSPEDQLYSAVEAGDVQAVQNILERSPKVNVNWMPGERSGPALVVASSFGKHEIARLLLAHKADPNLGSALSGSPLNSAAYHGDIEMCRILVAGGANTNLRSGRHMWTPLENARYKGHAAVVEFLKSVGALQ